MQGRRTNPFDSCLLHQIINTMDFEESQQGHIACPPTKVNEWVEQQLAAIKAESERPATNSQAQEV